MKRSNKVLKEENKKFPVEPEDISPEVWKHCGFGQMQKNRIRVLRSREFLIQVFDEGNGLLRMSINRTLMNSSGDWKDGISWDEIQKLKAQCGYSDREAVEFYPREDDVVNVANLRHIWILEKPLPFGWKK